MWSSNGLHSSSDMQPNQQARKQISKKIADLNQKWSQTKSLMADKNREIFSKKQIVRKMAETGTDLLHVSDGKVGNVAVGMDGTLVSPTLSVSQAEHYLWNVKGFPAITELVDIKNGVPVKTSVTNSNKSNAIW